MKLEGSSDRFPADPPSKSYSGIPWSMCISPLSDIDSNSEPNRQMIHHAIRCQSCGAYFCNLSRVDCTTRLWRCVMCGIRNLFESQDLIVIPTDLKSLRDTEPCFKDSSYEINLDFDENIDPNVNEQVSESKNLAIFFVLDLSSSEISFEIVTQVVLKLVQTKLAMHSNVYVGILTMGAGFLGVLDYSLPLTSQHNRLFPVQYDSESVDFTQSVECERILHCIDSQQMMDMLAFSLDSICQYHKTQLKSNFNPTEIEKRYIASTVQLILDVQSKDYATTFMATRVFMFPSGPNCDEMSENIDSNKHAKNMKNVIDDVEAGENGADKSKSGILEFVQSKLSFLFLESVPNRLQAFTKSRKGLAQYAKRTQQSGVMFDFFFNGSHKSDLKQFRTLAACSGGNLVLYSNSTEFNAEILFDDVRRSLDSAIAVNGILRIRTTPEFQVSKLFCRGLRRIYLEEKEDEDAELLDEVRDGDVQDVNEIYSLNLSGSKSSFGIDFEFCSSEGFVGAVLVPCVQVVMRFTKVWVDRNGKFQIQRVLRVSTHPGNSSQSRSVIQKEVHDKVVVKILFRKAMLACRDESPKQARILLRDWLANLLTRLPQPNVKDSHKAKPPKLQLETLLSIESLAQLPKLVFGLFKSRIFCVDAEESDENIFLEELYTSLSPEDFALCVYPRIYACGHSVDLNSMLFFNQNGLALRKDAIDENRRENSLFVIDNFTRIVIFYTRTATESFPLPSGCALHHHIAHLISQRPIQPQVVVCREDTLDANWFWSFMIEDGTETSGKDVKSRKLINFTELSDEKLQNISYQEFVHSVEKCAQLLA